ncbi:MAG: hypothetical protein ACLQRH_17530 [Acidimicrobiales bacterium]|jgi:hypothetical protein
MTDRMLPEEFGELEPFAPKWCLASETERYAQRMASSIEEMTAFYEACFVRAEEAIDHCDRFPLDAMPPDAREATLERFIEPLV